MAKNGGIDRGTTALGAWVAIGAGVGAALGAATSSMGVGIPLGIALGIVIGMLQRRRVMGGASRDADPGEGQDGSSPPDGEET